MSSTLGLTIGSVRRQRARWPGVGVAAAIAVAAMLVINQPPLPSALVAALAVAAIFLGVAGWRAGAQSEAGRLVVDPTGCGRWIAIGPRGEAPPVSIVPRRWRLGAAEIWLLAVDAHGRRLHLRVTKPMADDGHWHALRRWLVWSGRGTPANR
jgi:hypothetical protein